MIIDGSSGAGDSEIITVLLVRLVRLVRLRVQALPQSRALLLISRLRLIGVTRSLPVLPVSPSTVSGSCLGSVRSAPRHLQVVRSSFCLIRDRVLIGSEVGRNARVLLIRSYSESERCFRRMKLLASVVVRFGRATPAD